MYHHATLQDRLLDELTHLRRYEGQNVSSPIMSNIQDYPLGETRRDTLISRDVPQYTVTNTRIELCLSS